jgi:hypothetical protein
MESIGSNAIDPHLAIIVSSVGRWVGAHTLLHQREEGIQQ